MFGRLSEAADCASRLKRSLNCGSAASEAEMVLIATLRLSSGSRALYTSPIAPSPIFATTWYFPIRSRPMEDRADLPGRQSYHGPIGRQGWREAAAARSKRMQASRKYRTAGTIWPAASACWPCFSSDEPSAKAACDDAPAPSAAALASAASFLASSARGRKAAPLARAAFSASSLDG